MALGGVCVCVCPRGGGAEGGVGEEGGQKCLGARTEQGGGKVADLVVD